MKCKATRFWGYSFYINHFSTEYKEAEDIRIWFSATGTIHPNPSNADG